MKNYLILLDDGSTFNEIETGAYKIIKADSVKEALHKFYLYNVDHTGGAFEKAYEAMGTDDLRVEFINLFLPITAKIRDIIKYIPNLTEG